MIPGLRRSSGEGKGYPLQYSGLECGASVGCLMKYHRDFREPLVWCQENPVFHSSCSPGIALQAMREKKALSSRGRGRLRGFLELRRQCGVSHEVPQGFQGASYVVSGKSSIPFELQVRTGDCSPVTAGQNRPHLRLCPGPSVPLMGRQGSQPRDEA